MGHYFVLIEDQGSGDRASYIVEGKNPACAFQAAQAEKNRRVAEAGVGSFRKYVIVKFEKVA